MKSDQDKNLLHFTEGGTGVTNFHKRQHQVYYEAIFEYGDSNLFIGKPIPPLHDDKNWFALRRKTRNNDLSEFWKVFDKVNERINLKLCTQCGTRFKGEDSLCPHCAEMWNKINQPHEKDSDPGRPVRPHRSGGGHWVGH